MKDEEIQKLQKMSFRMRKQALKLAQHAGSKGSHLGGGLSCIEIMAVLYGKILKVSPDTALNPTRDRLLIGKGHCKLAHFPALIETKFIDEDDAFQYMVGEGKLVGYPVKPELGLEFSGGSLGMALSVGVGLALSFKKRLFNNRVFVLVGDGELNEGSNWEACMSAAHYKLNNLTVIVDFNHLSYDGPTEQIMNIQPLKDKFISFGFNAMECDGHNIADLIDAFSIKSDEKPIAIICNTVKGKGLRIAENDPHWHHGILTEQQYELAIQELEGDCTNDE